MYAIMYKYFSQITGDEIVPFWVTFIDQKTFLVLT